MSSEDPRPTSASQINIEDQHPPHDGGNDDKNNPPSLQPERDLKDESQKSTEEDVDNGNSKSPRSPASDQKSRHSLAAADVDEREQAKGEEANTGSAVEEEADEFSNLAAGETDGMAAGTVGDEPLLVAESPPVDADLPGRAPTPRIADDFFYEVVEQVSGPVVSEGSELPSNLLTLLHSFGYDCRKLGNLGVLDEQTVVFAAGALLEIANLETKTSSYLRSTSSGAIGAVAVHPSRKWCAVAEKGQRPNVAIYEYPSLKLYRILRAGTEKSYSFASFSPDGELLATVGGEPDFLLTLWNWRQESIVLRTKAFSQDVYRVSFSTELEGQLTTSGVGHIRFWKMAATFTGLKLQGALGRFGKTEISDIEGYVELPDGKVLSGSEWGNMLLWDGGLIKCEICRKGRKPCHDGPVNQIIMDEGELLITVGGDGAVKSWDFETIDSADVGDEGGVFELEPMNAVQVPGASLQQIIRCAHDGEEPTPFWLAQILDFITEQMVKNEVLHEVPVLLLANKQDLPGCLTPQQVKDAFSLVGSSIGRRDFRVMAASALAGDGVRESIDWVSDKVRQHSGRRPPVRHDS